MPFGGSPMEAFHAHGALHDCRFARLCKSCLGQAQDSKQKINPRWKAIEIPNIDPNTGITARFGTNESQIWQMPDPSSVSQARRSWNEDDRAFGRFAAVPILMFVLAAGRGIKRGLAGVVQW
jgi:hypothetical protein